MTNNARNIQVPRTPTYGLYGDHSSAGWDIIFNFEWIPQRSSIYNWVIPAHLHEAFIQFLFITEGGGSVLLDDKRWQIRAPALIIIPAYYVHGFDWLHNINGIVITTAQRPLESISQLLYPDLLTTLHTPRAINLPSQKKKNYEAELMPLIQLIEQEARITETGQNAFSLSLITALLVKVDRILAKEGTQTENNLLEGRKNDLLQLFRELINQRFRTHQPLSSYAQELNITSGHLARLCREELGITALNMIHARLIHEAKRDLVYSNISVRQIAEGLGFQDEAYFSRFFKRHTKQSPQTYRSVARQSLIRPKEAHSKPHTP